MIEGTRRGADRDAPMVDDRSRHGTPPERPDAGGDEPVESQDDARAATQRAVQAEFKRATERPETLARIETLRAEGHGIARHYDVTTEQLQKRLGTAKRDANGDVLLNAKGFVKSESHVDPETGRTTELNGKTHYCGPVSTRFDSAEDVVRADSHLRAVAAKERSSDAKVSIRDVLGPEAEGRMTGVYIDPADLSRYRSDVDFSGGEIYAAFTYDDDGSISQVTMYPLPARTFRPEQEVS